MTTLHSSRGGALSAACVASAFIFAAVAPASGADIAAAAKRMTISANDAVLQMNGAQIDGMPVLVRLSASEGGFSYADAGDGSSLFFTDESGRRIPHEIDTWSTSGESLVWVRVPRLSAATKIYAWYGGPAVESNATEVWSGYAGVWHLNDSGSGTASSPISDSTANGLTGRAVAGATATEGVIGGGWTISNNTDDWKQGVNHGCIVVPDNSGHALAVAPSFTVSGWVKRSITNTRWSYLISRKSKDDTTGWGLQFNGETADRIRFWYDKKDGSNEQYGSPMPYFNNSKYFLKDEWCYFTAVYTQDGEGYVGYLYVNGNRSSNETSRFAHAPVDGEFDLIIGGVYNDNPVSGDMDEVRLYRGALSPERIAASYRMETEAAAFVLSDVRAASSAPILADPAFTRTQDGSVEVSVRLLGAPARVEARVGQDTVSLSGGEVVQAGGVLSAVLPGVSSGTAFTCVISALDSQNAVLASREIAVAGSEVSVTRLSDANEDGLVAGGFTFARTGSTAAPLVVNYSVGGTAVPGEAYEALSGSVTIPAGSSSAVVSVNPLWSPVATPVDTTVVLSVAGGEYVADGTSARIKIFDKPSGAPTGYGHCVRLTFGYTGDDPVQNVAVPVRISESRIPGFSYGDFLREDYGDIAFVDAQGNVIAHEMEKFNPAGESVAWIRLASLAKDTVVYLVYGKRRPAEAVQTAMWGNYVGVWHLNEEGAANSSTAIKDSTANHLDGVSVSYAQSKPGFFAGGWQMTPADDTGWGEKKGCIRVPANTVMDRQGVFTVSGWVKHSTVNRNWSYLVSRKVNDGTAAWGFQFAGGDKTDRIRLWYDGKVDNREMYGNEENGSHPPWFDNSKYFAQDVWTKFEIVYAEENGNYYGYLYVNGTKSGGRAVFEYQPKDGTDDLIIGGAYSAMADAGIMDEVRFYAGVRSAAQIKAEYDAESDAGYVSFGEAVEIPASPFGFVVIIR